MCQFELENSSIYDTLFNQISCILKFSYLLKSLAENQQKLMVSEKMASLGRLTAGIAHEMNTPLAAVRGAIKELSELTNEFRQSIGNAQVLPEDYWEIAADMDKQIQLAERAAEKSAAFIRGIKSQTIDLKDKNFQGFNAAGVIADGLVVLGCALRMGRCELITNLDNTIELYGDPRQIVQIVTNLVNNAIEACKPDGGTITVKLAQQQDNMVELVVTDTGCGIPEEIKSKIFDPMFTTKPFGEGTGLGLSIVHELVKKYQGNISVNSKAGCTAFIVTLPLRVQ